MLKEILFDIYLEALAWTCVLIDPVAQLVVRAKEKKDMYKLGIAWEIWGEKERKEFMQYVKEEAE